MFEEKISDEKAKQMQPLVLAMIGDGVQTLFVREYVAKNFGVKVNKMSKIVSSVVKASSQSATYKKIEEQLFEDEKDIAHRARNTHIHSKSKNSSYVEYIYATAFEAIIGYMYLTGKIERMNFFLSKSLEDLSTE